MKIKTAPKTKTDAALKAKAENLVMTSLTSVFDRSTGKVVAEYLLSPQEAIVACWEQHHKNFNTWEYAKKMESKFYPLERTEFGWNLGNFWVYDYVQKHGTNTS